MFKKLLISLCLIAGIAEAQVSRNRLKTAPYGWIQRITPTNAYFDSTIASFYSKISDPSTGTGSLVLNTSPNITGSINIGNATRTNQKVLRVGDGVSFFDFGQLGSGQMAIWANATTPGNFNYNAYFTTSESVINGNNSIKLLIGTALKANFTGSLIDLQANTSVSGTFSSSSTSSIAASNYIFTTTELTFAEAKNIVFGTTTGTKFGTSASQKMGWFNATPVIQQTNGISGASYSSVGGSAVSSNDTFGGYTIGQIVAALKIYGFLQ